MTIATHQVDCLLVSEICIYSISISHFHKCIMTRAKSVKKLTSYQCCVGVEINVSPDTVLVISEAVFTANHLTGTDKQNTTGNIAYQ